MCDVAGVGEGVRVVAVTRPGVTPGVVRVAGRPSLLRATLTIEEELLGFGDGNMYRGLMSWSLDVEGGLLDVMCERVPVVFLPRGNAPVLRGEAVVANVDREVINKVNRPLRFVWSSRLLGSGPVTVAERASVGWSP